MLMSFYYRLSNTDHPVTFKAFSQLTVAAFCATLLQIIFKQIRLCLDMQTVWGLLPV